MKFSTTARQLKDSPFSKFFSRVDALEKAGKQIIRLDIGDPDFATPASVVTAAIRSLRDGETHYGGTAGLPELLTAIRAATKKQLGFTPAPEQITVGPSMALFYFALRCLANAGDEVIVQDPGFAPYYSLFDFIGLVPVGVRLREKNGFRLNPKEVEKNINAKTRLILVNSPHNPTGAVLSRSNVAGLAAISKKRGIPILSDEVYGQITYDARHYSPGAADRCRERSVIINSFSKTYAMTGWRLGYLIGPMALVEKINLLMENTIYGVPTFIQRAGVRALTGNGNHLRLMAKEYRQRRDLLVNGLNRLPGVSCTNPGGAFYAFPNITGTGWNSEKFAEVMLREAGVALLPGSSFGEAGEGYVRVAFTVSCEEIKRALKKMAEVLKKFDE